MPKLKAGDKFIYTKEMNDAKIKSDLGFDACQYIGIEVVVVCVNTDSYDFKKSNNPTYSIFHKIVDDCLDTTPKPGKDVWVKNVTVKLGEIEITKNTIKLKFGGDLLSHEDFTKEYNLYRRVHNKLVQLKKNKDI